MSDATPTSSKPQSPRTGPGKRKEGVKKRHVVPRDEPRSDGVAQMFYDPLTGRTRVALVLTTDAGAIAWPALPATIAGADGSVLRRSRSLAAQRHLTVLSFAEPSFGLWPKPTLEPSTYPVHRRTP